MDGSWFGSTDGVPVGRWVRPCLDRQIIPGPRRGHGVQLVNSTRRRTPTRRRGRLRTSSSLISFRKTLGPPRLSRVSKRSSNGRDRNKKRKETSTSVDPKFLTNQATNQEPILARRGAGAKLVAHTHGGRRRRAGRASRSLARDFACAHSTHRQIQR